MTRWTKICLKKERTRDTLPGSLQSPDSNGQKQRLFSLVVMGFFVFFLLPFQSIAQDPFSLENSRRFAAYLYDSEQFDLAADEYERVVFMDPADSSSVRFLLRSYRLQGQYEVGVKRAFDLWQMENVRSEALVKEIFTLAVRSGDFIRAERFIREQGLLDPSEAFAFLLAHDMLKDDWISAVHRLREPDHPQSSQISDLQLRVEGYFQLPEKNPWISAGLSTLVPGLGKVYTGDWSDGVVALLFVASNAWQAYRGFNRDGINSTYGWIFGSIGAAFWLGNVYGSYQAAHKYNDRKRKAYYEQNQAYIFSTF